MIALRLLGPIELRTNDGRECTAVLRQPKRFALLAYLAVARTAAFERRDRLLALFWPEAGEASARDALNTAIRFLRRELGEDAIVTRGDGDVGVAAGTLACDVAAFREAIEAGRDRDAVRRYRGAFLDGFHCDASAEFEEWAERERAALLREAVEAAARAAASAEGEGDVTTALSLARHATALGASDERALRVLVGLLDRAGDRAGALEVYESFSTRLRDDFDADPSPETQALVERIRTRNGIAPRAGSAATPAAGAMDDVPRTVGADTTPTVVAPVGTARPYRRRTWRLGLAAGVGVAAILIVAEVQRVRGDAWAVVADQPVVDDRGADLDAAISPDGSKVAYAAGPPTARRIFVRQLGSSRSVVVSDDVTGTHRWPRWSPDGTQLAFVVARGRAPADQGPGRMSIYVVPELGGPARLVADQGTFPAWSPDGREIAYTRFPDRAIRVVSLRGGGAREVVTGARADAIAWSPDGTYLAYARGNPGFLLDDLFNLASSSIWVVRANGGAAWRVSDSLTYNGSPAWTPDSRGILFVSNLRGTRDVYHQALRADGRPDGAATRLTTGLNPHTCTLSADGSRLACGTLVLRNTIWAAPIAAGARTPFSAARQVTTRLESVESLSLSRDGQWLLYDSNRSGNVDAFKVRVSGLAAVGEPVQLTTDPGDDFNPQLSPDGREIAFYSNRTGFREIFVMRADGQDVRQVTRLAGNNIQPKWFPDGQRLLFQRTAAQGMYPPPEVALYEVVGDGAGAWQTPRPVPGSRTFTGFPGPTVSPYASTFATLLNDSLELHAPGADRKRVLVLPTAPGQSRPRHTAVRWGADASTMIIRGLDDDDVDAFWSLSLTTEARRLLFRLDNPNSRSRRQEFATDGARIFFTVASDEADVKVLQLRR